MHGNMDFVVNNYPHSKDGALRTWVAIVSHKRQSNMYYVQPDWSLLLLVNTQGRLHGDPSCL